MPTNNPVNEQLLTATRAYLVDWADDGHSIIPVETLIDYGFSGVWLRDLAERHESKDDHKWKITVGGQPVDDFFGIYTLDLLEAVIAELGIGGEELHAAAREVGCIPNPMGRGTTAQLYTAAIRTALEKYANDR